MAGYPAAEVSSSHSQKVHKSGPWQKMSKSAIRTATSATTFISFSRIVPIFLLTKDWKLGANGEEGY